MLSVVIASRDRLDAVRATLACLSRHPDADTEHEIILVDDGLEPGLNALARGRARLVDGPHRGRAAARNAGAAAARGDRLLFLDNDILTPPGWLAVHAADGDQVRHGPLLEFPAARRWLAGLPPDPSGLRRAAEAVLLGQCGRLVRNRLEAAALAMASGQVPPVAPWLAAVGASLSLSRAAFTEVGGFDEGFGRGWGCEDLELGFRLAATGREIEVLPVDDGVHLSHAREGRWIQHNENLRRFIALHDDPAVHALPLLLGESGSVTDYITACQGGSGVSNHELQLAPFDAPAK